MTHASTVADAETPSHDLPSVLDISYLFNLHLASSEQDVGLEEGEY